MTAPSHPGSRSGAASPPALISDARSIYERVHLRSYELVEVATQDQAAPLLERRYGHTTTVDPSWVVEGAGEPRFATRADGLRLDLSDDPPAARNGVAVPRLRPAAVPGWCTLLSDGPMDAAAPMSRIYVAARLSRRVDAFCSAADALDRAGIAYRGKVLAHAAPRPRADAVVFVVPAGVLDHALRVVEAAVPDQWRHRISPGFAYAAAPGIGIRSEPEDAVSPGLLDACRVALGHEPSISQEHDVDHLS